jgi:hypothetical protein
MAISPMPDTACDPSLQTLDILIEQIGEQLDDAYARVIRIDEIILDHPKDADYAVAGVAPPINGINQKLCALLSTTRRHNEAASLVQSYLV